MTGASTLNPVPVAANSSSTEVSSTVSQPISLSTPASSQTSSAPPISTATPNYQVVEEVAAFLAHTPNYEITIAGINVVIIDQLSDAQSHDFGVQTFDMSDGSTLSIVGILQHLPGLTA